MGLISPTHIEGLRTVRSVCQCLSHRALRTQRLPHRAVPGSLGTVHPATAGCAAAHREHVLATFLGEPDDPFHSQRPWVHPHRRHVHRSGRAAPATAVSTGTTQRTERGTGPNCPVHGSHRRTGRSSGAGGETAARRRSQPWPTSTRHCCGSSRASSAAAWNAAGTSSSPGWRSCRWPRCACRANAGKRSRPRTGRPPRPRRTRRHGERGLRSAQDAARLFLVPP